MENIKKEYRQELVERMERQIAKIRTSFFADADQSKFAEYIGLSRQTFGNIENNKKPMTKLQYVAICSLLDRKKNQYISCGDRDKLIDLLKFFNKNEWMEVVTDKLDSLSKLYKYSFLDEWMDSFDIDENEIGLTNAKFVKQAKDSIVVVHVESFTDINAFNETMDILKPLIEKNNLIVYITPTYIHQTKDLDKIIKKIQEQTNNEKKEDNDDISIMLNLAQIKAQVMQNIKDGIFHEFDNNITKEYTPQKVIRFFDASWPIIPISLLCENKIMEVIMNKVIPRDILKQIIQSENNNLMYTCKNNRITYAKYNTHPTNEMLIETFKYWYINIMTLYFEENQNEAKKINEQVRYIMKEFENMTK